ncbi:HAD family hydrolase [Kitasatospora sp. NBC_01539]|uniref:HAD family hydrolase n=1 Tax=Kitasatospora sp. NBC_01539 TaxID=2903577 RepID=UPI00386032DA
MTAPTRADRPRYAVVATDLDGTLLRADLSISDRTRAALARAEASGALHLVVTGRPAAGCRSLLLERLDYKGLAVCGQGAQLYDVGADRLLSSATLDRAVVRGLLARIAERTGPLRLAAVTAGLSGEFVVTPGFDEKLRCGWRLADPVELLAQPVDKVLIRHPDLDDDRLAAVAGEICAGEVAVTHSGEGLVELLPAGVSKASGLAAAARLLGFTAAATVAFGDMPNDIPMLAWAGHGVAMGNAHADLRRQADEVAPSNEEDGVAAVLERLFPPPQPDRNP